MGPRQVNQGFLIYILMYLICNAINLSKHSLFFYRGTPYQQAINPLSTV
jgi:hypothetical protein